MNNRNLPCTCGSGKKFKKCCWKPWTLEDQEKLKASLRAAREAREKEQRERLRAQAKRYPYRRGDVILATEFLAALNPYRRI